MRLTTFLTIAVASWSPICQARIDVEDSCPQKARDALEDAKFIVNTALVALGKTNIRDAGTKGLLGELFVEDERKNLLALWTKMKEAIDDPSLRVLIRCADAGISWPGPPESKAWDLTTPFTYTGFIDQTGNPFPLTMNMLGASLPRKTECEGPPLMWTSSFVDWLVGDYILIAQGTEQAHIMICAKSLEFETWINPTTGEKAYDDRTVTTILKKGLDSKWADLEKIAPLSRLLVHELAHVYTIGGMKWLKNDNGMTVEVPVINGRVDKEAYMEGNILDGPRGGPPVYGLEGCRNFKKNNPGQSIWIADCQSLLALALSLQFPHEWQDFTWVTGSVNMGYKDNWPNYSPSHANQPRWNNGRWVPPARRDLDMLRDTTKKVNVFKKHVVGCPDGVDDGCKTFVA